VATKRRPFFALFSVKLGACGDALADVGVEPILFGSALLFVHPIEIVPPGRKGSDMHRSAYLSSTTTCSAGRSNKGGV
jgi:hypothetical protein